MVAASWQVLKQVAKTALEAIRYRTSLFRVYNL
jgi:hypothetical protein